MTPKPSSRRARERVAPELALLPPSPLGFVTKRLLRLIAQSCRVTQAQAMREAVYWYAVEKLRLKADVGAVVAPPRGRKR